MARSLKVRNGFVGQWQNIKRIGRLIDGSKRNGDALPRVSDGSGDRKDAWVTENAMNASRRGGLVRLERVCKFEFLPRLPRQRWFFDSKTAGFHR